MEILSPVSDYKLVAYFLNYSFHPKSLLPTGVMHLKTKMASPIYKNDSEFKQDWDKLHSWNHSIFVGQITARATVFLWMK